MAKNTYTQSLFEILPLASISLSSLLKKIDSQVNEQNSLLKVFTPNAEQFVQADENPKFVQTLQQADILLPDGMGLVWGNNFLARRGKAQAVQERIAGVDVVRELVARKKYRILLIGGRDYAQQLPEKVEWTPGFVDKNNPTAEESAQIQQKVKEFKPQIVFVAFGAPFQEQWVIDNQAWLEKAGVKVVMVVGGAFEMLTGRLKRAPEIMQKLGLEWLYRLIQEPWRWKRQLRLVKFFRLVVKIWL